MKISARQRRIELQIERARAWREESALRPLRPRIAAPAPSSSVDPHIASSIASPPREKLMAGR